MKRLIALSLLFSFSAFADFSDEHSNLCNSKEAKSLMGAKGNCQLVIAPSEQEKMSGSCKGMLADIECRVAIVKNADTSELILSCGDIRSPILSEKIEAEIMSYNASAIIKTSAGEYVTINDPKDFYLISSALVDLHLSLGEKTKGQMFLSLQGGQLPLSDVKCN